MFCDGAGQCECDLCVPYDLRIAGVKRARFQLKGALAIAALIIALCFLMARFAHAQMTGSDFCQSPNPAKSSVVVNCSGTGECLLVGNPVANQQIQVCAFVIDIGGTSPTMQFDYGTQTSTACDTGKTHLTGAMTASKSTEGPLDFFTAPAGNQLCLNLGGTTPTAVGVLTYVQK